MKFIKINAGVLGCLLAVALSGCDKNSSSPAVEDAKKSAESATTAAQQGVDKAVTEAKQAGEKVVAETKEAGQKAVATATEQVKAAGGDATAVIAKVQSLVAEKKYQEALTSLGSLKDVKLSDTQQKVVDGLKEQITKLMSSGAGLLGK